MNYSLVIGIESTVCIAIIIYFILYRNRIQKKICKINALDSFLSEKRQELEKIEIDILESTRELNKKKSTILSEKRQELEKIKTDILKSTRELNEKKSTILSEKRQELEKIKTDILESTRELNQKESTISESTKQIELLNKKIELTDSLYKENKKKHKEYVQQLENCKKKFEQINTETIALQELAKNETKLKIELQSNKEQLKQINDKIVNLKQNESELEKKKTELMSNIDLYSRLDEYVSLGHFEKPEYLYETSEEFAEEIKKIRDKQKLLIKNELAIKYPDSLSITSNEKTDREILNGQIRLMLSSFNIKCDTIIGKVKHNSFPRTLEQIERLAIMIEKDSVSLHCGFNIEYIKLKYEECKLQYQYTLKRQEEKEKNKGKNL